MVPYKLLLLLITIYKMPKGLQTAKTYFTICPQPSCHISEEFLPDPEALTPEFYCFLSSAVGAGFLPPRRRLTKVFKRSVQKGAPREIARAVEINPKTLKIILSQ